MSVINKYVNIELVAYKQSIGSQLWDAAFATQAIIASNLVDEYGSTLRKAHEFLKLSQVCS
jgi:beta-amyrin synthase